MSKLISSNLMSYLGYDKGEEAEATKDWKERVKRVCKPCWEIKYCPYGYLVEDFPLLAPKREEALEHNVYLESCLKSGVMQNGTPLDTERRKLFESMIAEFDSREFPVDYLPEEKESACKNYGHICPVFFVHEPCTETNELRRVGRSIPYHVKTRVARRDNYICQECGRYLKDDEVEFDHIIPISKGGSSEESNLRLTCRECNRRKSNKIIR